MPSRAWILADGTAWSTGSASRVAAPSAKDTKKAAAVKDYLER